MSKALRSLHGLHFTRRAETLPHFQVSCWLVLSSNAVPGTEACYSVLCH